MKQFYLILSGICIFLSISCTGRTKEKQELQTVKTDTVTSAGEQTILQFPGKVKAAQDINIAFRVSGTIRKICVENGTHVRKGELLAERVIALYQENGTTPNTYDKAVYGLKQITSKYQHHKDQLGYTRLYAPFDGYVQKHLFNEHETIGAGMPVISMISSETPEVEINLPAAEYIRRKQFLRYHCTFDIYPDKVYPMKYISITPKANANQLYTMRLQLTPNEQPLPSPGMNAMVTIHCDTDATHSLSVPQGAILQKEGQTYVFAYDSIDHTVHSRKITVIRLLSNGHSIVTSDNLQPGEWVVSSGVHHIKDGEKVKPLPHSTKTNIGGLL